MGGKLEQMQGDIEIDLNKQEELILTAYNVTIACTNLSQYIASAVAAIPDVCIQGIFKQYIGDDKDLTLYSLKAQEMQTLAEVLHQFAFDTYEKMVDTDNVLAMEIGNLLLNTKVPETSTMAKEDIDKLLENQTSVRENKQEAFEILKENQEK